MKIRLGIYLFFTLCCFWAYTQEEQESAEVFLEEYTDEFQENFFEALKQKGIQNYDRAVSLFLECKRLDSNNSVIDYELAKVYALDKKYIQAQEFAIDAINAKPADFWYLENLMGILDKQGTTVETIQQRIPFGNEKLQENLALVYFKKKKYQRALKVLKAIGDSEFAEDLTQKINDSLQQRKERRTVIESKKQPEKKDDPITVYKQQIEELLAKSDYKKMEFVSKTALDSYPLQPYFYYAYGTALNGVSKSAKAIEVLKSALDYVLDDTALTNKIYQELSKAHSALGNTQKANEYLNKIKSGL